LVLAFTFRRVSPQTVKECSKHVLTGFCIGIADTFLSPLGRECENFIASTESTFSALHVLLFFAQRDSRRCAQYRRRTLSRSQGNAESSAKGFAV